MKISSNRGLNLVVVVVIIIMSAVGLGCKSHVRNHIYYDLSVDYRRTFTDMVKAGKYDYVGDFIKERYYPIEQHGAVKSVVRIKAVLVCLNKMTNMDEVLLHINEYNMRPARIEELLAFGEQYPRIQHDVSIFSLNSSTCLGVASVQCVPVLFGDGYSRKLAIGFMDSDWNKYHCFLAVVRK